MSSVLWDGGLQLVAHSFHEKRTAFTYPVETYSEWAWLALESGSFSFSLGRGKGAVTGECPAGAWVLCPPGVPLYRRARSEMNYHFARFLPVGGAVEGLVGGVRTLRNLARLRDNFAALREAQYGPQAASWKAHLLLDTLRTAEWEGSGDAARLPVDVPMDRVRLWMEENLGQKISLESLAQEMRLTPPAFSRRFRAAVGQSPQEFLLQKRLDSARHLLLSTDLNIEVIAGRCGFSNGFYFSRLWTKRFEMAPSRFRRLHQV